MDIESSTASNDTGDKQMNNSGDLNGMGMSGPGKKNPMMQGMLIGLAVLIALVGLGGGYLLSKSHKTSTTTTANTIKTVKLGLLAPLTGDDANYGQVMQLGVELAQRDFGGSKVNFQLLVRDTQCEPAKASAAATELVKAGVAAIIGDTCSGSTLAALPLANAHKVLILSPSASSPALSIANDYFMRTYPTDSHQGVFTTALMNDRHIKKLAILYGNDAYGKGLDAVAVDNFKKLGGTVVANQAFESKATDFQSTLQTINALKPDALYIMTNAESTGAAIVTEAKQLGMTLPIYGSDALKDVNFLSDVGVAGNGMTVVAVTPGNRSFLDEYKATYGSEPANATGAQAYDAFMAIARAVSGGAMNGEQIRDAVSKLDFKGKSGDIKFDNTGDLAGGGYLIYTIQDGKFVEATQ